MITDEQQRAKLLSNCMAPDVLKLRVDAQVMLIKNMDESLVNGSIGKVTRFCDSAIYGTESDDASAAGGSKVGGGPTAPKLDCALFPVVVFAVGKSSTREVLVQPETWKIELPSGEVQASRAQVSRVSQ
jgi:ATP-dependent DNA helicase PIF1